MISYPSSFQTSRMSGKENVNPNNQKIRSGLTPFSLSKQKQNHNEANSSSSKSSDFLSVYNTINVNGNGNGNAINSNSNNNNNKGENSINTLINGFCSTIQQTQQNGQSDTFRGMVAKILNRKNMNKMDICSNQALKKLQLNSANCSDDKNMKQLLKSDFGQLIIQQLCEVLDNQHNISPLHERLIQYLIPDFQQDINSNTVIQHYDLFKEEIKACQNQRRKLTSQFNSLHKLKIQPKLWSDHFRLQITKELNLRQQKRRINYTSLCKCLGSFLTTNQVSIIFKHIYAVETDAIMPILDGKKTISVQVLLANLFKSGGNQSLAIKLEEKNLYNHLEHSYHRIRALQQQNRQYLNMLSSKDKQIQRLNRMVDFLQLQREQTEILNSKKAQIQHQALKNKYQKRIQQLVESNKQQLKLTQWYQKQLEAVMDSIHKQNIIHNALL